MTFRIESSAFGDHQTIPQRYTCEGADISPPLAWSGAPDGTKSFALLCDDPDAPAKTWHHWALFDVPATTDRLKEAYPTDQTVAATRQAVNDFKRPGYGGPCPPRGHGVHHYRFRLLALSVAHLSLAPDATCPNVEVAARPYLLTEAVLVGTYAR
jgi:Raf kinase inhibitor-like YbhB/YbcL family protein